MAAEKLVTVKTVQQAIAKLKAQGDRPSNRKIRTVLGGGSPNEIQAILRQIEDAEGAGVSLAVELPASLQVTILSGINSLVSEATIELLNKVQAAKVGQNEAVDELEQTQMQLATLSGQLQQSADMLKVKCHQVESLESSLEELKVERQQLIEAGEIARTESAKAQLQLERADQLVTKSENRLSELEAKLEEERELRHAAEVRSAAAEARAS